MAALRRPPSTSRRPSAGASASGRPSAERSASSPGTSRRPSVKWRKRASQRGDYRGVKRECNALHQPAAQRWPERERSAKSVRAAQRRGDGKRVAERERGACMPVAEEKEDEDE